MSSARAAAEGFADLSGPLAYWGPAGPATPTGQLSAQERTVLLRLRARLPESGARGAALSAALDDLLSFGHRPRSGVA